MIKDIRATNLPDLILWFSALVMISISLPLLFFWPYFSFDIRPECINRPIWMKSNWPNYTQRYGAPGVLVFDGCFSFNGVELQLLTCICRVKGVLTVICISTYRPAWRSSWTISRPVQWIRWSSSWTKASIQTSKTLTRAVRSNAKPKGCSFPAESVVTHWNQHPHTWR